MDVIYPKAPPLETGADAIAAFVEAMGITHVFGMAGESLAYLLRAVAARAPALQYVGVRHEQAAAYMADGFARVTGRPAAAAGHIGAGATNLINGTANAFRDGSPVLVLTGNEAAHRLGRGVWHEVDHLALFRPITRWNARITSVEQIPWTMRNATLWMGAGGGARPGPIHVDLTKDAMQARLTDVQRSSVAKALEEVLGLTRSRGHGARHGPGCGAGQAQVDRRAASGAALPHPAADAVRAAAALLSNARNPLVIAGAGVVASGPSAWQALRRLVQRTGWPVVTTDTSRGVVPESWPQAMGSLGILGRAAARRAAEGADAVLAVGTGLSDLVTFGWELFRNVPIVHVDIDPTQIGRHYTPALGMVADAGACLEALEAELDAFLRVEPGAPQKEAASGGPDGSALNGTASTEAGRTSNGMAGTALSPRLAELAGIKAEEKSLFHTPPAGDRVRPQHVVRALASVKRPQDVIACGAGRHSLWGRMVDVEKPRTFLKSVGLGTMGFAFPASVGASLGLHAGWPDAGSDWAPAADIPWVFAVVGDGDFAMSCAELETAARTGARVAVIVLNDSSLAIIKNHQRRLFGPDRLVGVDHGSISYSRVAEGFGVQGYEVRRPQELEAALQAILRSGRPGVIDVKIAADDNPPVAFYGV